MMRPPYKKLILALALVAFVTPVATHAFSISATILSFVGLLTGLGGLLLDTALETFVLNMGGIVSTGFLSQPLDTAWTLVRDFINLTFVFGLIYAGILTIVGAGSGKTKSIIVSIVIGALLVNFSLFISKVIIDISNVAAIEIYEAMTQNSSLSTGTTGGISTAFMGKLGLIDFVNPNIPGGGIDLASEEGSLVYVLVASIFLIIAAFVFAAGALLLTIRFAMLVFLMALSPVAFASAFLPGVNKWSHDWWHNFLNQAFFAPAYLFMLMITWVLLSNVTAVNNISGIFNSGDLNSAGQSVIYFVLLIVGLVASLVIAKQMGAHGAAASLSFGRKMRGKATSYVGRSRFGIGGISAALLEKNEKMQGTRTGRNLKRGLSVISLGTFTERERQKTFKAGKNAKFGGSYSRADDIAFKEETEKLQSREERRVNRERAFADYEASHQTGGSGTVTAALAAAEKAARNMTSTELEEMSVEQLKKIAGLLSSKQADQLKDSKTLTEKAKAEIKESREKDHVARYEADATAFLKNMKPQEVAKLSTKILLHQTETTVLEHINGDTLRRIQEDNTLEPAQVKKLTARIMHVPGANPSAVAYVTSDRGKNYYPQGTTYNDI